MRGVKKLSPDTGLHIVSPYNTHIQLINIDTEVADQAEAADKASKFHNLKSEG